MAAGTRLGPYEVLGLLGRGGMGEVYRARDDRLGRDVAIKVLRPEAGQDPERLGLFEQEARAAGVLNHPNLLSVFDTGRHDGAPYVVFELLEGQGLRDSLDSRRLPARKALEYAVQIARGLAAAHAAGIVHRDLKPANLFLTADGRVKILDFGLAKLRPRLDPGEKAPDGETASQAAGGSVEGTVGYMSPEQVEGRPVDHRSDIFSFGAVLYELLTGRRAFQRDTAAETMTAILREEPPDLPDDGVPAGVERVVRRCLEKRREERFQSAADIAFALEALSASGRPAASRTERGPHRWPVALLLILLAILGGFALHARLEPPATDLRSYRFTPLATDAGYEGAAAWSPDGATLAYLGEAGGILQVFTRSLAASMSARITDAPRDCKDPFWSTDGARLYYVSLAGRAEGLWTVGAAGGSPQVVLRNVTAAALSPDGATLAFLREDHYQGNFFLSLWTSSPPGAEPVRYPRPPLAHKRFATGHLRFAPDGSKLGLWAAATADEAHRERGYANPEFWVVPWPSGEPRRVLSSVTGVPDPAPFSWMPDGRHIVFGAELGNETGRHLWLADTEGTQPHPLTATSGSETHPAVSPDGRRIAFTAQVEDYDLMEVPLDGSPLRGVLSTSRTEADPAWSPSGGYYAYVTDRTGRPEIWLRSRDGTLERPLVTRESFGRRGQTFLLSGLAVSPDGSRIAYQRRGPTGFRVWVSAVAGGPAVELARDDSYQDAPTWSPDGGWIAFTTLRQGRWALAKARVGSGEAPVVIKHDIIYPSSPRWSPRGDWITSETAEGFVLVSPDGQQARRLSEEIWLAHGWAPDGAKVYAVGPTDDLHLELVAIDVVSGLRSVIASDLGPSPPSSEPLKGFSLGPDGRSFLTSVLRLRGDLWLLEGFEQRAGLFARLWPSRP